MTISDACKAPDIPDDPDDDLEEEEAGETEAQTTKRDTDIRDAIEAQFASSLD
jgi:hypothetical protein